MSAYDYSAGMALEERIEGAEDEALKGRWEFGHWMLSHVPEGRRKLPNGFLEGLVKATGSSRAELAARRQFAEDFDQRALSNAVRQRVSWHRVVNQLLGSRGADDGSWEEEAHSAGTEEWETPPELFVELDREFAFELDVCAAPDSARCERYFSPADDGLRQVWEGTCWMNPPAGLGIEQWVAKAHRAATERGATVVCLLPARVDAEWWWEHCTAAEVRFLRGRLSLGRRLAPFPSAVVVFGRRQRVVWWEREREGAAA